MSQQGLNIHIRAATTEDAPRIAKVHIDTWRTAYAGIVPQDYLDHLSDEESKATWIRILQDRTGKDLIYVAENSVSQVVGFVWGTSDRNRANNSEYSGELCGIYILDICQQQGIGKRLAQALVSDFLAVRSRSMLVETLALSSACRFYEKLGGSFIRQRKIRIGEALLSVSIYGWQDISILLSLS